MQSTFVRWLAQVLLGMGLIVISANVAWIFAFKWWQLNLSCAVTALVGAVLIVRAEARERPQRRIRKAQRTLVFPTQWAVKFGRRLPDGTLITIAVIRSDGVRFVVEICRERSVDWGTPIDGSGRNPLVGPNRKPLKPDPVPALLRAAQAADATPVLWLPRATTIGNLRDDETKLLVVMGRPRDLKHALQSAQIAPQRRPATPAPPTNQPTDGAPQSAMATEAG